MRIDTSKEPEFSALFNEGSREPSLVVLNPGKRKRFLKHEGPVTAEDVSATLDKILGGDAKFKAIKDNKLPDFTTVYESYLQ